MLIKLTEGSGTIDGTKRTAPYTFTGSNGTTITTTQNQTATLQFPADQSLIRMDQNTSIQLGGALNSDGQTIAQATLDHGVLWGRILTQQGVDFASASVVA